MTKHPVRHRHLVILPAVLVLVGLSLVGSFTTLSDSIPTVQSNISAVGTQAEFSFPSGDYGVLYSGFMHRSEDVLHLDYGAAGLATDAVLRVEVGDIRLTTIQGSLYVSVDERAVTVAAMTAPVYVMLENQRTIVPAGMQWQLSKADGMANLNDGFADWLTSRKPTPLPKSFMRRKQDDLSEVSVEAVELPSMYEEVPDGTSALLQFLLPTSAEKQVKKQHEKALGALRFVVEQGSTQALEAVLADALVQAALVTPYGQDTLVRLLHGRETSVRMLLLQQLVQHEDLWAVASAHDAYVDVTWSIFEPETSVESRLTRVFMLPYVAQTAAEFPQYIFDRHRAALLNILPNVGNTEVLIENVLTAHVPAVFALEDRQYPLRARALRATLLALIADALNPTDRMAAARKKLDELGEVVLAPLPPKPAEEVTAALVEPKQEEAEQAPQFTAEQAEAKAYDMLTQAGALFSVQSAVAAFAPNQVRVSDLLFSTPTEDRLVGFTLNVATEQVTDISVNGDSDFPYSPTFEGFVTWIRK